MKKNLNQKLSLQFSPTAWAKLVFMRDLSDNEVGGFGITNPDDLLFVTDFVLVRQKVTVASVSFEDSSVADFFEHQFELGRKPEQFARIWIHTHPGFSPTPSITDEETFYRVFGKCDWSVMFILAQDKKSYARLHFKAGPGGDIKIPAEVDYSREFGATDFDRWREQYKENVIKDILLPVQTPAEHADSQIDVFGGKDPFRMPSHGTAEELLTKLDSMDPMERQDFMDELAVRNDFWDEYGSEVF